MSTKTGHFISIGLFQTRTQLPLEVIMLILSHATPVSLWDDYWRNSDQILAAWRDSKRQTKYTIPCLTM